MDRKAIIVVSASLGFILLWSVVIVPKFLAKPLPPGAIPAATVSSNNLAATATTNVPTAPALAASTNAVAPFVAPAAPETTLTLTNRNARYIFTSHGGGLKEIELVRYPESVARGQKTASTTNVATLNHGAPVPVMALLGDAALQGDGEFQLSRTANGVRAEKTLTNGLVMVKDFVPSSNYLFTATVRVENRSAADVAVGPQEWVIGTASPMNLLDKQALTTVGLMWSDGNKAHDTPKSWFDNRSFTGCLTGHQEPRTEYRGGESNVVWVAAHDQFFAIVAIPPTNAPSVVAHTVKLPKPPVDDSLPGSASLPAPEGFQTAINYPGFTVKAGGTFERTLTFYAGPKEYRRLAEIAGQQGNDLDHLMGFGFFGFVSKALLLGMNWLHDTLKFGYGLAIVFITILIKTVFWPLTAASTRSMKRMQTLQPQMKALQEKYKDDPAKMNRKLMEFMKENRVSPLGGCLPMFLQIPVFFGFFTMIRSAIELRGAPFLWVHDLSQADTLFYLPGTHFPFNLLPLIMGATMLWQARLTPPSPGMDPAQQKIMKYMPLMFMVFLYNYSAALTLYWTTNNLLTILQTKLTKAKAPAPAAPAVATPAKRR
jgi:YidC/Oxa1 family membrane protein insertase